TSELFFDMRRTEALYLDTQSTIFNTAFQLSSYLTGTEWFDLKILGKRWELHNIFANHGQAGMGALRGRTIAQMNTNNSFRNPSIVYNYANTASNNVVTVDICISANKVGITDIPIKK
ncbi:18045_t:CDS:2, partial [Racocetra persica]